MKHAEEDEPFELAEGDLAFGSLSYDRMELLYPYEKRLFTPLSVLNALQLNERFPVALYYSAADDPSRYQKELVDIDASPSFVKRILAFASDSARDSTIVVVYRLNKEEKKENLLPVRIIFQQGAISVTLDPTEIKPEEFREELQTLLGTGLTLAPDPPLIGTAKAHFDVFAAGIDLSFFRETLRDAVTLDSVSAEAPQTVTLDTGLTTRYELDYKEDDQPVEFKTRELVHLALPDVRPGDQVAHVAFDLIQELPVAPVTLLVDTQGILERKSVKLNEGVRGIRLSIENLFGEDAFDAARVALITFTANYLDALLAPSDLVALYTAALGERTAAPAAKGKRKGKYDELRASCGSDLFPANYTSRCSPPARQPVVARTAEERAEYEARQLPGGGKRPSLQIDCVDGPSWAFCLSDSHPYPSIRADGTLCCFSEPQKIPEGRGISRERATGKARGKEAAKKGLSEQKKKRTTEYDITGKKILEPETRRAHLTLPDFAALGLLRPEEQEALVRVGVKRGPSAFLRAVMLARKVDGLSSLDSGAIGSAVDKLAVRRDLAAAVEDTALLRQEDQTTPDAALRALLAADDRVLDPFLHISAVEERTKRNIFLFKRIGDQGIDLLLPMHRGPHYKARRHALSVMVLVYSEEDPIHCELLCIEQPVDGTKQLRAEFDDETDVADRLYELVRLKQALLPPPVGTYTPRPGDTQVLDPYGKLRGFLRTVERHRVLHILEAPSAPHNSAAVVIGGDTVLEAVQWPREIDTYPADLLSSFSSVQFYRDRDGLQFYVATTFDERYPSDPVVTVLAPLRGTRVPQLREHRMQLRATNIVLHVFMYCHLASRLSVDDFFERYTARTETPYVLEAMRLIPQIIDIQEGVEEFLSRLHSWAALSKITVESGGSVRLNLPSERMEADMRWFLGRLPSFAGWRDEELAPPVEPQEEPFDEDGEPGGFEPISAESSEAERKRRRRKQVRVSIATEVPRYGGVIDGYYRDSTDFDAVVSAGRVRIRIGWRTSSEPTQFEVSNYDPNVTHPQFVRYGRALYLVQRVEGEGPQSRFAAQSIIAQWVKTGRNQGYTLPSQMPLGPTVDVLEPRDLTHPVAAPKEFYVVSDGRRYSAMLRLERNFFEAL